jgi:DNA-binding PadR family transcriptional regulator
LTTNLNESYKIEATEQETDPSSVQTKKGILLDILDIELLALLSVQEMNGYRLGKKLGTHFQTNVSFGTLYPHLERLSSEKLVIGRWIEVPSTEGSSPKRIRIFRLTDEGKKTLKDSLVRLQKIVSMIETRSIVRKEEQ